MKAIHHARVYVRRGIFCEAVLLDGERVAAVSSNDDILGAAPPGTEKFDAGGALLLPGFHDSHLHLQWIGRRMGSIEAAGARSVEEVVKRGRRLLREQRPAPGAYLQGAGVNPDLFSGEKRDLTRSDLDRISREHPIILSRHCGHTIYCNSLALERAGFGERAPVIEGGLIETDADGRPTGVCRENANALVRRPMPPPGDGEIREHLERAMKKALSLGITAAGSYDTSGEDFCRVMDIYRRVYEGRGAAIRITAQCGISGDEKFLDFFLKEGFVTNKVMARSPGGAPLLTMGPLKLFADGTLGGCTAWLSRPYRDKPGTSGFPVIAPDYLKALVRKAAAGGMQVVVHAIGDAGIAAVLDAVEAAEGAPGAGGNPLRHGIIHCQITTPGLIKRIARSGAQVLAQPVFLADDLAVLESRVGPELAASSYAWASMEQAGARVSYGTDAPVSPLDPLECVSWAVNRRDTAASGGEAFCPGEKVDVAAAIDNYTAGSAWSSFDEGRAGRISPGFLADFALLDRDIFALPPEDIRTAKVRQTWLGGELAYQG
jgi:predicted amidohydrolase YtcJ